MARVTLISAHWLGLSSSKYPEYGCGDVDSSISGFVAVAWPGTQLEPGNHLVADLHPRTYRVRATYRADGDNWMILVQLQPMP
ncbi:hypothetical protein E1182_02905 [Micromonospora sp. KC721]|nr:hypothetical protein E1182_02905 [Micromonospora sp. KC721]